jgi:hypothetical protein
MRKVANAMPIRVAMVQCSPVQRQFCLNPEPGLGAVWALRPNCGPHWGLVQFRCGLGHFQVWTWTRPQTRNLSYNRKDHLHNHVQLTWSPYCELQKVLLMLLW